MTDTPFGSLAVALTEAELCAFFPGEARRELMEMFPATHLFRGKTSDALAEFAARHQAQVLASGWETPPLLDGAQAGSSWQHLQYVCHLTGSVRRLVPRAWIDSGLRVSNWGDGAAETVAENVVMLILSALRRTQFWGREMHERAGWRDGYGGARTLFDRRVAVHGFGRIARALLPLLSSFRTPVSVYSEGVPDEFIRAHGAHPAASLTELFDSGPDVFVEIEALTPKTRGTVREEHLRALKPRAVFVNGGRGAVVDEAALERVARAGGIEIALDVYAAEPLPKTSPLRGLPNVTLMPHIGGPTEDRYPALGRFALDNLRRWRANEPLEAEVRLELYDIST